MSNPLLEQPKIQMNNQMQQIVDIYKYAKNPQQLIQSNPQLQSILSMYKGDAKSAFYAICKQKGIDPNSILSLLK